MGQTSRWMNLSSLALLVLLPTFATACGGSNDGGADDERQPLSTARATAPADAGKSDKDLESEDGGAPPSSGGDSYLGAGTTGGSSNTESCDVTNLKYVKEAWDVINSKTPELCNAGCDKGKCCYAESAVSVCVAK